MSYFQFLPLKIPLNSQHPRRRSLCLTWSVRLPGAEKDGPNGSGRSGQKHLNGWQEMARGQSFFGSLVFFGMFVEVTSWV